MNLRHLKYFQALAYNEHITNTAAELSITQPTLSQAISKLEEELGTCLYVKKGRNIKLTKYGRIFLTYVENALDELEKGEKRIRELNSPTCGIVDLAFIYTLGSSFVPNIIKSFLKQDEYKNVFFSFNQGTTENIIKKLKEEEFDIAFCSMTEKDPEIEYIPLAKQELVVVVPNDHPLANRESIDLEETAPYPYVYFSETSGLRSFIDNLFAEVNVQPKIACEVEEDNAMAGLVSINYGIAIMPKIDALTNYPVTAIPIINPKIERFIYMVSLRNHYVSPVTSTFRNFVISYCEEHFLKPDTYISG